ncbi:MAG: oligosaccharide flippase family protein, partial [Oscillospiraceae bacterium]
MPKSEKKQSFLQGAAILVASTVIVKAIGALFKIPLNNLLDGVGMAYFSSAYTIFNTLYALAVAGLPVAVAKLVSENVVLGRYRQVKQILRISRILFIVTGSVGFLVMLFGARPFAEIVKNPGAFLAILVMSPAVIFCCLMASYRGYYQGLSNMYPTAVSQVVEALAKLIFGTGLAWYTTQHLGQEYSLSGTVLGMQMNDAAQAGVVISQYAAAGAIAGIVISTFFGAVYCWGRYT